MLCMRSLSATCQTQARQQRTLEQSCFQNTSCNLKAVPFRRSIHTTSFRASNARLQAFKICRGSRERATRLTVTAGTLKAVIFDCDGVILESEELHRNAYNATFQHFELQSPTTGNIVDWSVEFYDKLQNSVGGGKQKMRWFFGQDGWPANNLLGSAPSTPEQETTLIDTLQDWKSKKYQDMIGSGEVPARPGVLRLMDECRAAGLKVAVCSASTKSSVIITLKSLIGEKRFQELDVFIAGDDVPKKKPDPSIYILAAEKLGVFPHECVVVEDSTIGLKAALGAGMRCIVTYTSSTESEPFEGAERIMADLGPDSKPAVTAQHLMSSQTFADDRILNV